MASPTQELDGIDSTILVAKYIRIMSSKAPDVSALSRLWSPNRRQKMKIVVSSISIGQSLDLLTSFSINSIVRSTSVLIETLIFFTTSWIPSTNYSMWPTTDSIHLRSWASTKTHSFSPNSFQQVISRCFIVFKSLWVFFSLILASTFLYNNGFF